MELIIREVSENTTRNNPSWVKQHKRAATYFKAAAENYMDAAKHHKEGDHEKAAACSVLARKHLNIAKNTNASDLKKSY